MMSNIDNIISNNKLLFFYFFVIIFTFGFCVNELKDKKIQNNASFVKESKKHFCSNYEICLGNLAVKQRECFDYSSDILKLKQRDNFSANSSTNFTLEPKKCTKKKRKEVHSEMAEFNLKKIEKTRDCILKNIFKAKFTMNPQLEKKCVLSSYKLTTSLIIPYNSVTNKNKKFKKNLKFTDETTKQTRNNLLKKNITKKCKHAKKLLFRICRKISKCCSIVKECDFETQEIDEQILNLKSELKLPFCENKNQ